MEQTYNPYLPECVYIPDGEPHVFGERVYVYGSCDIFNSSRYCAGNYNVWSAPVDDLSNWRNEGIIYRRKGVKNRLGVRCMWAPDVVKGADGKYYLYFCFDFKNYINVAVCDTPAGKFKYLGIVKHPDGTPYGKGKNDIMCFDPAVLADDDGSVYLYSGFSAHESLRKMLWWKGIRNVDATGGQVVKLKNDMLTVAENPKTLIPGKKNSRGTGFEGHEMYEASSIRKMGNKYYFVYSSVLSHELCYAISDYPDRDFKYGGTIISNGDIGYKAATQEQACNYWGNNHGSIVSIHGQAYVFYHRQTNKTEQCRQGCAEKIEILPNGSIKQVEMTSCGLNGGPLAALGKYKAYIACNLYSKSGAIKCAYGPFSRHKYNLHPCITQEDGYQFIQNMRNGAVAGFKYFDVKESVTLCVTVRGDEGKLLVSTVKNGKPFMQIDLQQSKTWRKFTSYINVPQGIVPLYFTYIGQGRIDFSEFEFVR